MADYFRHARAVARVLDRARRTAPVPVALNLGRTHDGVRFIDARKAAIQPATWLAAFQSALDAETSVADEALDVMRQHGDRFSFGDFLPTAEHRDALLRFLAPRPGLYARLSEMHDCGLLARLVPPFQAITCRVVRDFYHKYTVDEHTLLTVRNLERLADAPEHRQRFASIARELESPELLVLALLLHDTGKAGDEDHAVASVRLAERLLDEWALPEAARETVLFLIRHHLRMSQVAFRRDTEDPEIVREFAALVGTEERLKLLCLMTLADVEAVSPETLTRWKEELLWRLYVDTYNYLTLQYGDDLIERTQAAAAECVARRPADLAAGEVAGFLEGLPRRYLQLFDRRAIYRARPARAQHPSRRSPPAAGAGRCRLAADRGHARQADAVREHLRRPVVVRDGHPPRPRDDQPQRAGPRRRPVHRQRALSRAQPGRVRRRAARPRGRRRRPIHRRGSAARAARRAAAPPRRARRADRPRRRRGVAALHRARDHRARQARLALSHQPGDRDATAAPSISS